MTAMKTMNNLKSRGFTLIELLTVMIIISILAIISLGVQRASVQSARAARTRTTIMKIDTVLMSLYEKYQYKKVDVSSYSDANLSGATNLTITDDQTRGKARQILRTLLLRELLRMDMPVNSVEVNAEPPYLLQISPLTESYRSVVNENTTNAELLYLIVTNGDPETRTMFHDREIGVGDGGGNVFLDGWGNPICFLRWAPGLVGSSRQPDYETGRAIQCAKFLTDPSGLLSQTSAYRTTDCRSFLLSYRSLPSDSSISDAELVSDISINNIQEKYADPLDPLGLGDGWLLVPLVFSWGPDGEAGMPDPVECANPFVYDFKNLGAGDSSDASQDNITNHNYYNE